MIFTSHDERDAGYEKNEMRQPRLRTFVHSKQVQARSGVLRQGGVRKVSGRLAAEKALPKTYSRTGLADKPDGTQKEGAGEAPKP